MKKARAAVARIQIYFCIILDFILPHIDKTNSNNSSSSRVPELISNSSQRDRQRQQERPHARDVTCNSSE
jgi:hypothetical protein